MKTLSWLLLILLIGTVALSFAAADTPSNTTGYLLIASNPSGSEIYLDAVYKGTTAEAGAYVNITGLTSREYTLLLKKTGYSDYVSTVNIISGQSVKVLANLTPGEAQKSQGFPLIPLISGVIILLIIVGVIFLYIRHRRKPKGPGKIELD